MKNDEISIEILEDGTIKTITDPISSANHSNAEQFVREMGRLAGGETKRARRHDAKHVHSHGVGEHKHQH